MEIATSALIVALKTVAALQIGIALLNLFIERLLGWRAELERADRLLREVFRVHSWFISVTLALFGSLTWRFAEETALGGNDACRWLSTGIGLFWALRTVLQVAYYSSSHWRGRPGRTAIHVSLLVMYGGMALVYLWCGLGSV